MKPGWQRWEGALTVISNLLIGAVGDQNLSVHHGVHLPWGRVQCSGTKGAGSQSSRKSYNFSSLINRAKCFIPLIHKQPPKML